MSLEYKHSKEACYLAKRLLKTSRNTSEFIKAYHQLKGNLDNSAERLSRVESQLSNTLRLAREMCMTQHPMHNSTHVGTTNNAAVINNVALVSTHTDQYGQTHHSSSPTVFIFAVCLMVALFLALFIWCCKGAVGRWFIGLCTRQNREQLRNSPQISPQYAINMDQIHNARSSVYSNRRSLPVDRQLSLVPEIQ